MQIYLVPISAAFLGLGKLGGEGIPPEVRALAEWGCDVVQYIEATAEAIVFTSALKFP